VKDAPVAALILERAKAAAYRRYFTDLLVRLCAVDTTVGREPAASAAGEAACLGIVAAELGASLPTDAIVEKRPIDPAIAEHPDYTAPLLPYGAAAYYADRYNVIATAGREDAPGLPMIYNAHVDTVAPFLPPRVEAGRVFGRGAADDKGSVALLLTSLRLLRDLEAETGVAPRARRVYQFVIEEESGGNGTLSALLDPRVRGYAALVMEITSLAVHPANRGAVWYQAALRRAAPGVRIGELAAEVILALEEEGAAVKRESAHPLFLPHHVQTCHGVLGPYGKHPSAVNDHVAFRIRGLTEDRLAGAVAAGIADYTARHGDKSGLIDRHVTVEAGEGSDLFLGVHGKAGHMGALHLCDCALTKAACIAREAVARGGQVELAEGEADEVLLEGGQGFVPTHGIDEITGRLARAARRGAERYARCLGAGGVAADDLLEVRYEKLHNDAYAGDLSSPLLAECRRAWERAGRPWPAMRGWDVSCDARLFHRFGHDVAVWGPGELRLAHSPDESIAIDEAMEALPLLVLLTLGAGGALEPTPGP
jgi:acetylornithine deacetylase/succinyl-diaminopimelate desuccinylase-like protein